MQSGHDNPQESPIISTSLENAPPLLRLKNIIGCKKSTPPVPPILPISKTTWWKGVKEGKFPKPVHSSHNLVMWKHEDIKSLVKQFEQGEFN